MKSEDDGTSSGDVERTVEPKEEKLEPEKDDSMLALVDSPESWMELLLKAFLDSVRPPALS